MSEQKKVCECGDVDCLKGSQSFTEASAARAAPAEQVYPVAWMNFDGEGNYDFTNDHETAMDWQKSNGEKYKNWLKPLYTAPDALQAEVKRLREDNDVLTMNDMTSHNRIEFLYSELADTKAENQRLREEVATLMKDTETLEGECNAWLTKDAETNRQLAENHNERKALQAEVERLKKFEAAYMEWSNKSEWIRSIAEPKDLGKHLADIVREKFERLSDECTKERLHRKSVELSANQDNGRMACSLIAAQADVERLRKEVERLNKALEVAERSLQNEVNRRNQYAMESDELDRQVEALTNSNKACEDCFIEMRTERDALKSDLKHWKHCYELLLKQHMPLEPNPDLPGWNRVVDADRLAVEREALQAEVERLREEVERMNNALNTANFFIKQLTHVAGTMINGNSLSMRADEVLQRTAKPEVKS